MVDWDKRVRNKTLMLIIIHWYFITKMSDVEKKISDVLKLLDPMQSDENRLSNQTTGSIIPAYRTHFFLKCQRYNLIFFFLQLRKIPHWVH